MANPEFHIPQALINEQATTVCPASGFTVHLHQNGKYRTLGPYQNVEEALEVVGNPGSTIRQKMQVLYEWSEEDRAWCGLVTESF